MAGPKYPLCNYFLESLWKFNCFTLHNMPECGFSLTRILAYFMHCVWHLLLATVFYTNANSCPDKLDHEGIYISIVGCVQTVCRLQHFHQYKEYVFSCMDVKLKKTSNRTLAVVDNICLVNYQKRFWGSEKSVPIIQSLLLNSNNYMW